MRGAEAGHELRPGLRVAWRVARLKLAACLLFALTFSGLAGGAGVLAPRCAEAAKGPVPSAREQWPARRGAWSASAPW